MKTALIALVFTFPIALLHAGIWPSGGALASPMFPGATVAITWDNALEADTIRLELWDGEHRLYRTITTLLGSNSREYVWTIPTDIHPGALYRFVLRDVQNPSRAEYSLGFHRILSRGDVALTVEDDPAFHAELVVSPLPADERARIAWTKLDAISIDVIDMAGAIAYHSEPQRSTRACVALLGAVRSGSYVVVAKMSNGMVLRRPLLVTH